MRFSTIATIEPAVLPQQLPLNLEQKPAPVSLVLKLCVIVPTTFALLLPFLLVGEAVALDDAVRAVLLDRPRVLVPLGLALAFWAVLFAWPMQRIAGGLARSRQVSIRHGVVNIGEKRLFSNKSWNVPLSEYVGVLHHVRASISGLRHELILLHADRDRSVLLAISNRFSQADIDSVTSLLGHREVPPAAIYKTQGRRSIGGGASVSEAA